MNLIKTISFELAVYAKGNPDTDKLALLLPGKLDTKDYAHMRSHVDFLAMRGYYALSFDPPGTWESPGDLSLYTMTNYLAAINELIEHFGNKPTFVMGHSRGATMSIYASIKNPHITGFTSVMSSYPVGGFPKENHTEWREKGYYIEMRDLPPGDGVKVKEFRLPYAFYEDQLTHQFSEEIHKSTKPKLYLYGTDDVLATPSVVKEFYEHSGSPKELVELESNHDYRHDQTLIDEVNAIVGTFLDKHSL